MILMQSLLLYMALLHRPPSQIANMPFSDTKTGDLVPFLSQRPYNFWQWRTQRPYWTFLLYFTISLASLQILIGSSPAYTTLLGYVALAIEATLPLPQMIANQRRRGCKGFRVSVIANWLVGDAFKMVFFFAKGGDDVPWAFKLCGIFQALCDLYLGLQYYMFGDGEVAHPWESNKQAQELNYVPPTAPTQASVPAAAEPQ
jgi:solute carrier family 66, member 2